MRIEVQMAALFAASLALSPGGTSAQDRRGRFTEEEIDTLLHGGTIRRPLQREGAGPYVAGSSFALVNAPRLVVWAALTDVTAWPRIFPNTYSARTIARKGEVSSVRLSIGNRLIRLGCVLTVVARSRSFSLRFDLNRRKPHDIDEVRGQIRLLSHAGDRTLVAFSTLAKVPLAPIVSLLGDRAMRTIEERVLGIPGRLKKWVEGPGRKRYVGTAVPDV